MITFPFRKLSSAVLTGFLAAFLNPVLSLAQTPSGQIPAHNASANSALGDQVDSLNAFWDNARRRDGQEPVRGSFAAEAGMSARNAASMILSSTPPEPPSKPVPNPEAKTPDSGSIFSRIGDALAAAANGAFTGTFRLLNRAVPWHSLPTPLAIANLAALRLDLEHKNLYATSQLDSQRNQTSKEDCKRWESARSPNGVCNDLRDPDMGRADLPFGRQQPLDQVSCKLPAGMPSSREVSLRLMTRKTFKPATIINNTAMIWLQFQVHDWVQPGRDAKNPIQIPLKPGDSWPQKEMYLDGTEKLPDSRRTDEGKGPPLFPNKSTPWWDAGQIYGNDAGTQQKLRAGKDGLLLVDENGLLPLDPAYVDSNGKAGIDMTGRNQNYWMGLSLLHTLFTLEHNAVAKRLKEEYPSWTDDQLFDKARLVTAALIAKIHTVEWTPAILPNPALQVGMNSNWWGLTGAIFGKDSLIRKFTPTNALLTGIPASETAHNGADYSLTHEFDIVYHMHALVPDTYEMRSAADGRHLVTLDFNDLQGLKTREVVNNIGMANLWYSLGMSHPGAIRLGNFPKALQNFQHFSGRSGDLAAADIERTRERCLPLYNDFRENLRMPRIKTFEELADGDAELAKEISDVYGGDIDKVDALVGMFAEPLPPGFGFSDTAFRVFILMASRRLKSDRFFTSDYRPDIYTQVGYDWVEGNTFKDVLLRHYPALGPALQDVEGDKVFRATWKSLGQ